jgi:hypothetical protein
MPLLVALFGLVVIVSLAFEFSVLAGLVVTIPIIAVFGFVGLCMYVDHHDR